MEQESPPIFACAECGRRFASSTSLNRHAKNHSSETSYVCPTCHVVFFRQDVLTRHVKLHQTAVDEQDAMGDGLPRTRKRPRKRCHTACDRCRSSKTKCNGQKPCESCARHGKPCTFDDVARPSRRISRILSHEQPPPSPSSSSESLQTTIVATDTTAIEAVGHSNGGFEAVDAVNLPIIANISDSFPVGPLLASWDADTVSNPLIHETVELFDPEFSMDMMPWPWLHERAFLSNDGDAELTFAAPELFPDVYSTTQMPKDPAELQVPDESTHISPSVALNGSKTSHTHISVATAEETLSLRRQSIDQLVSYAGKEGHLANSQQRMAFWNLKSDDISRSFSPSFQIGGTSSASANILQAFVQLYFDHFHRLWPLLSHQNLELGKIHPYLYLVLSSIGAMYGCRSSCEYGTMMHTALCSRLVHPVELETEDPDGGDFLWLAQSRLLTQVAALYFGQVKAFSFAQHLGVLLVTHARKLNLFSGSYTRSRISQLHHMRDDSLERERLNVWLDVEARRRLAFGVFRGDAFTSIVLNTRPLVSLDEIDLEFPTCESVWAGPKLTPRQALDTIDHDRTPSKHMRASDIYRILLDRDEVLPPLDPLAHELSLFGLQGPLWRFAHDDQLFERLTGHQDNVEFWDSCPEPKLGARKRRRSTITSEADTLDIVTRRMSDLIIERERLKMALCKWERALPTVKSFARTEQDRNFILSSLILYHLGYMRLLAPIEAVHQIQYQLGEQRLPEKASLQKVMDWARSPRARLAISRANSLCSLIAKESRLAPEKRSKVNLLAFIGLHHGSALLWAYLGSVDETAENEWISELRFGAREQSSEDSDSEEGDDFSTLICHLIDLYGRINPAGWSSFVEATRILARKKFPRPDVASL